MNPQQPMLPFDFDIPLTVEAEPSATTPTPRPRNDPTRSTHPRHRPPHPHSKPPEPPPLPTDPNPDTNDLNTHPSSKHTLAASPHGEAAPTDPNSDGLDRDVPLLVTIPDAGRLLGVGRTTMYELIGAGEVEVVHIGRAARIPVDSIAHYVGRLRSVSDPSR